MSSGLAGGLMRGHWLQGQLAGWLPLYHCPEIDGTYDFDLAIQISPTMPRPTAVVPQVPALSIDQQMLPPNNFVRVATMATAVLVQGKLLCWQSVYKLEFLVKMHNDQPLMKRLPDPWESKAIMWLASN